MTDVMLKDLWIVFASESPTSESKFAGIFRTEEDAMHCICILAATRYPDVELKKQGKNAYLHPDSYPGQVCLAIAFQYDVTLPYQCIEDMAICHELDIIDEEP